MYVESEEGDRVGSADVGGGEHGRVAAGVNGWNELDTDKIKGKGETCDQLSTSKGRNEVVD